MEKQIFHTYMQSDLGNYFFSKTWKCVNNIKFNETNVMEYINQWDKFDFLFFSPSSPIL